MKIELAYVTFKQAKLLKGKGFIIDNTSHLPFYVRGEKSRIAFDTGSLIDTYSEEFCNNETDILQPTQALVIEWLRVVHGIFVMIHPKDICGEKWEYQFEFSIHRGYGVDTIYSFRVEPFELFNSPQEAYSAAIDYVLKGLI